MTPEQYQKVKHIFQQALELPASHRPDYVDHASGGDDRIRTEVERMLASDTAEDCFLDDSPVDPLGKLFEPEHPAPKVVGNYEIVRELGRGGMGAVYLAARADDQYRKLVAIKLVLRDRENSAVVDRFRTERQILASLDHPNIAALLDGGATPEGLPYLVMEYVEGEPIDVYCDRHNLNVSTRLILFLKVCAAVQHAHQNLVIHRDLKPSNILVKKDRIVKLLDFGIAKIVNAEKETQQLDRTAPSMRLLTPEYASPEQVKGEAITTSTDVYQLGVVLYELLTGNHPFEGHTRSALMQKLATSEPMLPSTAVDRIIEETLPDGAKKVVRSPDSVAATREGTPAKLKRRLQGDLDAIMMRALARDPANRYASAEEFAEDIRRHIGHLPVNAHPYTPFYVAHKFVWRHKTYTAAAISIFFALITGLTVATREAHISGQERAKAQRRFDQVRKMANSFLFEVHDAMAPLAGTTEARQILVSKAMEYLDSLSREVSDDPGLARELADAYQRVGDLQGNPNGANLGNSAGALQNYQKALSLRQELLKRDPRDAGSRRDLAGSYDAIADLLVTAGTADTALENYQKSLAIHEELYKENPSSRPVRSLLVKSYQNVVGLMAAAGRTPQAIEMSRKAVKLSEDLLAEDPSNATASRNLAAAYARYGQVLDLAGMANPALESLNKALAILNKVSAANPGNAFTRRDLSLVHEDLGRAFANRNSLPEAWSHYGKALALRQELSATDPRNAQALRDLGFIEMRMGDMLARAAQRPAALESYKRAADVFQRLAAQDPANLMARRDLALVFERLGNLQASVGNPIAALDNYRKLQQLAAEWSARDASNAIASHTTGVARLKISEMLSLTGDRAGALDSSRGALTVFEELCKRDPENANNQRGLAWALIRRAETAANTQQWPEAVAYYQRTLTVFEGISRKGPLRADDQRLRQNVQAALARAEEEARKPKGPQTASL
ncbi:MAG: protein kinase [Bryobacteraceae bacterium]|nr:protein kinase [Bryobacteraceae bacterium]